MQTPLYLDTARLGLTRPSAGEALYSLHQFLSCEGLSQPFDVLLRDGFDAWPLARRQEHPGLAHWKGVSELRSAFRGLLNAPAATVLFANRTAQLMRLAARLLFLRCRRVLVSDLEWPGYLSLLETERVRVNGEVVTVPLRGAVFQDGWSAGDVCRALVSSFRARGCEGLFLSAVSFEGIQLPFAEVCATLRAGTPPRFAVIDGAQAIGHTPVDLSDGCCDLLLAGCHKWLRAQLTMGLAVCPRQESASFARTTLEEMVQRGEFDDPLEAFARSLEDGSTRDFTETVSLSCLFAARASLAGAAEEGVGEGLRVQLENADRLSATLRDAEWHPLPIHDSLRSGMALVQAADPDVVRCSPDRVRESLHAAGVTVTCYQSGLARLSLPRTPMECDDLRRVRCAFLRRPG